MERKAAASLREWKKEKRKEKEKTTTTTRRRRRRRVLPLVFSDRTLTRTFCVPVVAPRQGEWRQITDLSDRQPQEGEAVTALAAPDHLPCQPGSRPAVLTFLTKSKTMKGVTVVVVVVVVETGGDGHILRSIPLPILDGWWTFCAAGLALR